MDNERIIRPSTPISRLVEWGIVPQWMWDDVEPHGMYEAENILCEWDWEWGWDIGDGYTAEQLEVLRQVREVISAGIDRYYADKELVARDDSGLHR